MNSKESFLNDIDSYKDSIFAIIGFMNFYLFDDSSQTIKNDVQAFQGRRFDLIKKITHETDKEEIIPLTPDVAVLLPNDLGIIGEVKLRFPKDQNFWEKDFSQIMKYDNDLVGWPTENQKVISHDIVLILHESQEVLVRRYYEESKVDKFRFIHPFVILEFHRTSQRNSYIFFQIKNGELSNKGLNGRLEVGVQVPLEKLSTSYSEIKLYDANPPLPYLLQMIWQDVVAQRVFTEQRARVLRKNQKVNVELLVEEIINELHNSYTFKEIHRNTTERQSKIPKREWIVKACDKLVEYNEAEWLDQPKTKIRIFFSTKYNDILDHFMEICSNITSEQNQIELFNSGSN